MAHLRKQPRKKSTRAVAPALLKQLSPQERHIKLSITRKPAPAETEASPSAPETARTIPVTTPPHVSSGSAELDIQFL